MRKEDLMDQNFVIIDQGRDDEESSIFLIEEGEYKGFGYISKEDSFQGIEELKEAIEYVTPNKEYNAIVRNHLYQNPRLEIQKF